MLCASQAVIGDLSIVRMDIGVSHEGAYPVVGLRGAWTLDSSAGHMHLTGSSHLHQ
jgi:hypothetical protein